MGGGREVDPAVFSRLSQDQMLDELESIERLSVWLAARALSVTESLVRARERSGEADLDAARSAGLHRAELHAGLDDEIALATGLTPGVARSRFAMVVGDPERAAPIRVALAAGHLSWARASRIHDRVAVVPVEAVTQIVERVVAPYPARSVHGVGGLLVPHEIFTNRLSRLVARHSTDEKRHRDALEQRTVSATVDPFDGTGEFRVTGHAARVAGAVERVDEIARRLRAEGDARTLRQLRSDVALDLVLFGHLPGDACLEGAARPGRSALGECRASFSGTLPPARVHVSVSLSSLLGVTDEPGTLDAAGRQEWLSAQVVRDAAVAAGSTWWRLVTDPATGYLADLSTQAYAVTGHLRERITARDRISRAPGRARPARLCDLDHEIDFADGGPSSEANLSAKDRRSHNHKTRGTWTTHREPTPTGELTWTTPTGRTYATTPWDYRDLDPVDPHGRRRPMPPRRHRATDTDPRAGAGADPGRHEGAVHTRRICPGERGEDARPVRPRRALGRTGDSPRHGSPTSPTDRVSSPHPTSGGAVARARRPGAWGSPPTPAQEGGGIAADRGAEPSRGARVPEQAGECRGEMITRDGTSIPAGRVRELMREFDIDVEEAFTHVAAMLGLDPWVRYDPRYDTSPDIHVVRPRGTAARADLVPWERREIGPPPF